MSITCPKCGLLQFGMQAVGYAGPMCRCTWLSEQTQGRQPWPLEVPFVPFTKPVTTQPIPNQPLTEDQIRRIVQEEIQKALRGEANAK